jgi:transcriptional regulator with XRE-family HTH domain
MRARATSPTPPLARLVRANRERLHLTQGELAEQVGVSRSAISELEAGRIEQPRAAVFARLGKVLGIPAAVLLAAAGYPAEGEMVMSLEVDEIALLAGSLAQLAGTEREWLRTRLMELRDLLVMRRSQGPAGPAPKRGARQIRSGGRR